MIKMSYSESFSRGWLLHLYALLDLFWHIYSKELQVNLASSSPSEIITPESEVQHYERFKVISVCSFFLRSGRILQNKPSQPS